MTEPRRNLRIVVLGNELASAAGDPKGMGWVGRVVSKTQSDYPRVDIYALPAPEESTAMLAERWQAETSRRFAADTDNRLVIALGSQDLNAGISMSRSRLNLANVLDSANSAGIKCFVIGPIPSRNPELNYAIEHLSSGFEDVCSRRNVTYVDAFHPLVDLPRWNEELQNSEWGLPGQQGHGLLAWLVLNAGWYAWLDLPEQEF